MKQSLLWLDGIVSIFFNLFKLPTSALTVLLDTLSCPAAHISYNRRAVDGRILLDDNPGDEARRDDSDKHGKNHHL